MKKTTTPSTPIQDMQGHTPGELRLSKKDKTKNEHGIYGIDIDTTGMNQQIITVWCGDTEAEEKQAEADAARIVKCWNGFDELQAENVLLKEAAERALDYLKVKYPPESEILHQLKKALSKHQ